MCDQSVYVVATTLDETQHAIALAERLACAAHTDLAVIVPVPERLTVSSARAHVHDVPVEDAGQLDPGLTVSAVRALVSGGTAHPEILVTSGLDASNLASILPAGATVVVCGQMRRFFDTPEQHVARELSKQKFDVVFLPKTDLIT